MLVQKNVKFVVNNAFACEIFETKNEVSISYTKSNVKFIKICKTINAAPQFKLTIDWCLCVNKTLAMKVTCALMALHRATSGGDHFPIWYLLKQNFKFLKKMAAANHIFCTNQPKPRTIITVECKNHMTTKYFAQSICSRLKL